MTKTAARMIIVLGFIVKPVVLAGEFLDVPCRTYETWGGFPVVDVFCLCFMEGEGTTFTPGGVLVDG